MNINKINELLAYKYSLYKEDVDEAFNDEKIKAFADKINSSSSREEMTDKDERLREMIYSYLSRRKENGIYVSVYKGVDEHRCVKEGIRHPKNIVSDILYRVGQAKLEPDEYFTESYNLKEIYSEYKYVIPEPIAQKCRFMCDVDYGSCEGIYYDLMLFDHSRSVHSLIVGKTLSKDEQAFMKMSYMGSFVHLLLKNDFCKVNTSVLNL